MPLVQAKCPNCNGSLEVDTTKFAAECKYCGTTFIVEKVTKPQVTNNYNSNYNHNTYITNNFFSAGNGNGAFERRVERVNYAQFPESEIESIIKDFPADYRSYLLYFDFYFDRLMNPMASNAYFYDHYFKNLYYIANSSNRISTEQLDDYFITGFTKFYERIVKGPYKVNGALLFVHHSDDFKSVDCDIPERFKELRSKFFSLYNIGLKNAEILNSHGVGIAKKGPLYGKIIVNNSLGLDELFERILYCSGIHCEVKDGNYDGNKSFKVDLPEEITNNNIQGIVQSAKENVRRRIIDEGKCIYCNEGKLKMNLMKTKANCTWCHSGYELNRFKNL